MPTVSATHAKQNFAAMLDLAQREPVRIQRHDRDLAVLVSADEYERMRKLRVRELIRLTEENDELLAQLLADEG
jgi:prevent-host-death family protein